MRMEYEITLRSTTTAPDSNGIATQTNTDTTVYADIRSVKRTEFYAAQAAGVRADITFIVNGDEYGGQMFVVYGGVTYKVSRSYQPPGTSRVELTCTRR